jgi:hypothetical protein
VPRSQRKLNARWGWPQDGQLVFGTRFRKSDTQAALGMGDSFSSVRSAEMNPVLSKPRSRDNVVRTRENAEATAR